MCARPRFVENCVALRNCRASWVVEEREGSGINRVARVALDRAL